MVRQIACAWEGSSLLLSEQICQQFVLVAFKRVRSVCCFECCFGSCIGSGRFLRCACIRGRFESGCGERPVPSKRNGFFEVRKELVAEIHDHAYEERREDGAFTHAE